MTESCFKLHQWFNGLKRLNFPFNKRDIPFNGVYILFEKGENAHGMDRIVRIGTHTGSNQLPSRLEQHFIKENKDRSVFRKNIGRCLLNKNNDPYLRVWELDLTPRAAREKYSTLIDRDKQLQTELEVSKFIQDNFSFVVIRIDDSDKRLELESKIISTVSLCNECYPSDSWLGNHSPKKKIRQSGLWQVNELNKEPLSGRDMTELKNIIDNS